MTNTLFSLCTYSIKARGRTTSMSSTNSNHSLHSSSSRRISGGFAADTEAARHRKEVFKSYRARCACLVHMFCTSCPFCAFNPSRASIIVFDFIYDIWFFLLQSTDRLTRTG